MHTEAFQIVNQWCLTPQGKAVSMAFVEQLNQLEELVPHMRGEVLVQFGRGGNHPWLDVLQYQKKWIVAPVHTQDCAQTDVDVSGFPRYLPFDQQSIDCLVAPITLETYPWQSHPVDEMDRVLKPMGHIVFLGVNPLSLWGMAMRLGCPSFLNSALFHPVSVIRLKRALLHRGYALCHLAPFYYIPPVRDPNWIHRLEFLNELGKMVSPCPGGFYCMIVQKVVTYPLHPLTERKYWRDLAGTSDLQPV